MGASDKEVTLALSSTMTSPSNVFLGRIPPVGPLHRVRQRGSAFHADEPDGEPGRRPGDADLDHAGRECREHQAPVLPEDGLGRLHGAQLARHPEQRDRARPTPTATR